MTRDKATIAFIDVLFLIVLIFALMIHPPEAGVSRPLSITVSWTDEALIDIDSYVLMADGRIVSFRRKDQGTVHVDKDDLGARHDRFQVTAADVHAFRRLAAQAPVAKRLRSNFQVADLPRRGVIRLGLLVAGFVNAQKG